MISIAALAGAALVPSPSISAPATASTTSGSSAVCSQLAGDYDQVEKALAMTFAEGVGDNSAPRETYRQIESSNSLAQANMIITLMEARHCALPDHAPSIKRYFSPALTCSTDRLKTSQPESCKMENWQPSE
jgi:hypothetical protein